MAAALNTLATSSPVFNSNEQTETVLSAVAAASVDTAGLQWSTGSVKVIVVITDGDYWYVRDGVPGLVWSRNVQSCAPSRSMVA